MENQSEKVFAVWKKDIGESQASVECKISFGEFKAQKILSFEPLVYVSSVEALDGEATFSGTVTCSVLFLTDSGAISSTQSNFDFSSKFISQEIEPLMNVSLVPKILDFEIENVSSESARVVVTVSSRVTVLKNQEITVFNSESDSLVKKESTTKIKTLVGTKCCPFEISEAFSVPEKIGSLLRTSVEIIPKSASAGTGYFVVEGETNVSLLYSVENEDVSLKTLNVIVPFKEEIEFDVLEKDNFLSLSLCVKNDSVISSVSEDDGGSRVSVSFTALSCVSAFSENEIPIVSDAFSLSNQSFISLSSFFETLPLERLFFEQKIDGQMTLEDNQKRIDKVVSIAPSRLKNFNCVIDEDELVVSGIAEANIVYLNDENGTVESIDVAVPFSISAAISSLPNMPLVDCEAILSDLDISVKKGRDIYLDGKIKVYAVVFDEAQDAIISDISLGEELLKSKSAIEVYFASKGQTVWDIAKDLHESPEVILNQNKDLPDVFEGNEKIVVYHQREVNFA